MAYIQVLVHSSATQIRAAWEHSLALRRPLMNAVNAQAVVDWVAVAQVTISLALIAQT